MTAQRIEKVDESSTKLDSNSSVSSLIPRPAILDPTPIMAETGQEKWFFPFLKRKFLGKEEVVASLPANYIAIVAIVACGEAVRS